jgi:hypothetical protein
MLYRRNLVIGFCVLLAGLSLTACAEQESIRADKTVASGTTAGPKMTPIAAGTALPAGYKVDPDRTIIFGTNEKWTGRLSYTTTTSADEVFDFLHKEMANFGWTEVTAMRADPSLLTFTSPTTARNAVLTIARGSVLGSTRVDKVVSPSATSAVR